MVVAPSPTDVVRYAGGWLFDRVMSGWDVTVIVKELANSRPLQIIGAGVVDFECCLSTPVHEPWPHALAVSGDLYESDLRVRDGLLAVLDNGGAEVTMWGQAWPAELDGRVDSVQHQLSLAAKAFKTRALAAAAIPADSITMVETFRSAARLGARDLIPAG